MAVSMSVPESAEADMEAWYVEEHIPMLLAVPGWRRSRRYVLTSGDGPKYLSLHEIDSHASFDLPEYKAAISTPWRNRIVELYDPALRTEDARGARMSDLPPEIDTSRPHPARVYDYLIGGKNNFAADRETVAKVLAQIA